MQPDWDIVRQAIGVLIIATPFMFGILSLFAIATYLMALIPDKRS